ncbi:MAG: hypothetical protein QXE20_02875 [Acidilobaceae archaeon]
MSLSSLTRTTLPSAIEPEASKTLILGGAFSLFSLQPFEIRESERF